MMIDDLLPGSMCPEQKAESLLSKQTNDMIPFSSLSQGQRSWATRAWGWATGAEELEDHMAPAGWSHLVLGVLGLELEFGLGHNFKV